MEDRQKLQGLLPRPLSVLKWVSRLSLLWSAPGDALAIFGSGLRAGQSNACAAWSTSL
jgi:hypothetical protein